MNDLLQFTQTLMRHPSLVAEVALLVAILLGAGRASPSDPNGSSSAT